MSANSPADVLVRLLSRCLHPRRQASLKLIDSICQEQGERRSTDFSVGVIGRLSKARGGPGVQAIRNPLGGPYRELIAAYAAAVAPLPGARRRPAPDAVHELLKGIPEHRHREWVRSLMAEVGQLRADRDRLRMLENKRQARGESHLFVSGDAVGGQTYGAASALDTRSAPNLSLSELEALSTVLDQGWQRSNDLVADERGRLHVNAETEFPVGFLTMLKKVEAAVANGGLTPVTVTKPTR